MIKLCTHELKKKKKEKIATKKPWILLDPWIAKLTFQVGWPVLMKMKPSIYTSNSNDQIMYAWTNLFF